MTHLVCEQLPCSGVGPVLDSTIQEWEWQDMPPLNTLPVVMLSEVRRLLFDEAGEEYSIEFLYNLPLETETGSCWLVRARPTEDSFEVAGLFWTIPLNEDCVRITAFAVKEELQRMGYGTECWKRFLRIASNNGYKDIQLEVRTDNHTATQFYLRRGLEEAGLLPNYYTNGAGYLMKGKIQFD